MTSGVEPQPQSIEDGDPADATNPDRKKKPRPSLISTAKSVKDIVKKNRAARLLQRIFRRKRKKKGKKQSKLEEIPEGEEETGDGEEHEEAEGDSEEEEAEEAQNDTAEGDDSAKEAAAQAGVGEVDDSGLAPVDETAESTQGYGPLMLINESDKVKSKAEVGEIEKDHIRSVRELAKMMQSRDEETKKKNEAIKVKHSAAAQFFEESGTAKKGKSPEVRKVPLRF